MRQSLTSNLARWGALALVMGAGLVLGRISVETHGTAQAATALPPLERLVIEDDIRQKLALYGFYADGDGMDGRPRDLRALADTLMTADVVSEIHSTKGGPPKLIVGRDLVAGSPPENDPDLARRLTGRHFLVSTVFDDVTASVAHTRTAAVYFDASKNTGAADCAKTLADGCAGKPVKTIMWVYQMTWRKTPQGWRIARNVLRDDN